MFAWDEVVQVWNNKKGKWGEKRSRYMLTSNLLGTDYQILRKTCDMDKTEEKRTRKVIEEIRKAKSKLPSDQAVSLIDGVLRRGLYDYIT